MAIKDGFSPVAVTVDYGFNDDICMKNAKSFCKKNGIEHVILKEYEKRKKIYRDLLSRGENLCKVCYELNRRCVAKYARLRNVQIVLTGSEWRGRNCEKVVSVVDDVLFIGYIAWKGIKMWETEKMLEEEGLSGNYLGCNIRAAGIKRFIERFGYNPAIRLVIMRLYNGTDTFENGIKFLEECEKSKLSSKQIAKKLDTEEEKIFPNGFSKKPRERDIIIKELKQHLKRFIEKEKKRIKDAEKYEKGILMAKIQHLSEFLD